MRLAGQQSDHLTFPGTGSLGVLVLSHRTLRGGIRTRR
jgi:hypothetical protein